MTEIVSEHPRLSPGETLSRFVLWAFEALGLSPAPQAGGAYEVELPEDYPDKYKGLDRFEFCVEAGQGEQADPIERVTLDSPLFDWLIAQLSALGQVLDAVPAEQPQSVHELSSHLFAAYEFEEGQMHLGGCSLEDQPLLRLTYATPAGSPGKPRQLVHDYRTTTGEPLEPQLIRSLGLEQLLPYPRKRALAAAEQIEHWLAMASEHAAAGEQTGELVAVTIVWCKYAEGTVVFSANDRSLDVHFSGLAQLFALGQLTPPRVRCRVTGMSSHHLALTEDGRITVAEAVERCCVTGSRVLRTELQACEATGKLVLPEFLESCPVSGKQALPEAFQVCAMCGQSVVSEILQEGRCEGCRSLLAVRKDDPRIARVLGEHPKLDRWRSWRVAEMATVYILVASALVKKLLLVLDQETLEPQHLAIASRFSQRWVQLPPAQRPEYLA